MILTGELRRLFVNLEVLIPVPSGDD